MNRLLSLLCAFASACALASTACAVQYELRDLGTFDGLCANAYDINNRGEIVGGIGYADISFRTFLLDGSSPTQYLPAPALLNDNGQIAYANDEGLFLVDQDATTLLSGPSALLSWGISAMNDKCQIVGRSDAGWIWDSTNGYQPLGIVDNGNSGACDINDNGLVVGCSEFDGDNSPFWWQNGDLTVCTDFHGVATAVNNSGLIVGYGHTQYGLPMRAVTWLDGVMTELPLPTDVTGYYDTDAQAVNNHGLIMGGLQTDTGHAIVWDNGVCVRLPELDGGSSGACDMNDAGWIVGASTDADGRVHAVLWQPVPEPPSVACLLFGMLGGALSALRRRRPHIRKSP